MGLGKTPVLEENQYENEKAVPDHALMKEQSLQIF